ncbi:hypothetical protein CsSME_00016675 [Camellia sinensis var. sinensis]
MKAAKGKGAAIRVPKEALKPVDYRSFKVESNEFYMHIIVIFNGGYSEIDEQAELLPDGTLLVGGQAIAVIYFRAGYAPTDYPLEPEWKARLLMEQSSAVKCPSISYHLAGTKKIQQELLAKPNVLER